MLGSRGRSPHRGVRVGEQCPLYGHRPIPPGLRDRRTEFHIRGSGQLLRLLPVHLDQVLDAQRDAALHRRPDEVRKGVTDRRVGVLGDRAAYRRGDPPSVQQHRRVAAAVGQQRLGHRIRQPALAHRQPVPTGPVRGQAHQDPDRGGRVAAQPGQLRLREIHHAPTLSGLHRQL